MGQGRGWKHKTKSMFDFLVGIEGVEGERSDGDG